MKTFMALTLLACMPPAFSQEPLLDPLKKLREAGSTVYKVVQTVRLSDIPADSHRIRLWLSIPDDSTAQKVLDLSVTSAPGPWRIVRDRDRGCRFLFVETENPQKDTLSATFEFTLRRDAVSITPDPSLAKPLPDSQKALFAEELRLDAPHMEVTDPIRKIAREVVGGETNPATQAVRLLSHVADKNDHYSRNPSVPNCGVGDAESCLSKGGGCCTDMHSLFIALARAEGIPARLQMGYRLQPRNENLEVDPGYRCWAEYYISGYGWIPTDIVEADALTGKPERAFWFTSLTPHRLHLNEGREFDLPLKESPARVNLMSIGYAEIDGKPVRVLPEDGKPPQLSRVVRFTSQKADKTGPP